MRGKNDLPTSHPVIEHQQSSIKELEFVVPENVKNPRLGHRGVVDEPDIIKQHPGYFLSKTYVRFAISPQVQKIQLGWSVQLRAIHSVTADHIQMNSYCC